jgi:hypothetical protein
MQRLTIKQFKTEFIIQAEAAILPKVTMTQFMLVIACCVLFLGLLSTPLWLSPVPFVLGYVAGYRHHGELVGRRLISFAAILARQYTGKPRQLNLQQEWDRFEVRAMRQQSR